MVEVVSMARFVTQLVIAAGVVLGGLVVAGFARAALRSRHLPRFEAEGDEDDSRVNARNSGMIH